jgi:hypothetical protein
MHPDDMTLKRIALTQSRFREANERIELAAHGMTLNGLVPFICECADERCAEIVRLSLEGYEEVRHNPRLFFCAPRHQAIAVDTGAGVLVEETPGCVLVETIGVAAEVAADEYRKLTDPPTDS